MIKKRTDFLLIATSLVALSLSTPQKAWSTPSQTHDPEQTENKPLDITSPYGRIYYPSPRQIRNNFLSLNDIIKLYETKKYEKIEQDLNNGYIEISYKNKNLNDIKQKTRIIIYNPKNIIKNPTEYSYTVQETSPESGYYEDSDKAYSVIFRNTYIKTNIKTANINDYDPQKIWAILKQKNNDIIIIRNIRQKSYDTYNYINVFYTKSKCIEKINIQ